MKRDRGLKLLSFWAINDALNLEKLKNQLLELKALGLEGVVFHPRNYPGNPEYLSEEYMKIVSELILYAKAIKMRFWLYDENGWPSGTASGKVLEAYPDSKCFWIEPESFEIIFENAINSFDKVTTEYFIQITHQRYKECLDPEAFEYITGFFSDEVGFLNGHGASISKGGIPWSEEIPIRYLHKYNEDIRAQIPALFGDEEKDTLIKVRYWELVTDLIVEGYYEPIEKWCEANDKLFVAHLKGEESPYFQVSCSGSCFRVLNSIGVPAIDALERYLGNHYYPRIPHSLAMQFGKQEAFCEAMGGAGWGVTPEHLEDYILWLVGHGITEIALHLNHLTLNSEAVRDWPPSTPCHLTWKEAFKDVLDSIRNRVHKLPDLTQDPEVLVVTPTRGVMSYFNPVECMKINEHDGANVPKGKAGDINEAFLLLIEELHGGNVHYELTEESMVEQYGEVVDKGLQIGQRVYPKVILAKGCRWGEKGLHLLEEFKRKGYQIVDREEERGEILQKTNKDSTIDVQVKETRSKVEKFVEYLVKQSKWQVEELKENNYLVEYTIKDDNHLQAVISIGNKESIKYLYWVSLDAVDWIEVKGKRLEGYKKEDRWIYEMPVDLLESNSIYQVNISTTGCREKEPILFLKGDFGIYSVGDYKVFDNYQVATKGPFILEGRRALATNALVETGLPFYNQGLKISKKFSGEVSITEATLNLSNVYTDACKVWLDGKDLGWHWGTEIDIYLGKLEKGREYLLEVELIPNTFNTYGPHKHIEGDRYLTSPDQFKGIKNFADRDNAPEYTLTEEYKFIRFGIGESVKVYRKAE